MEFSISYFKHSWILCPNPDILITDIPPNLNVMSDLCVVVVRVPEMDPVVVLADVQRLDRPEPW